MKNKKAQIWFIDFMVGIMIFVIVIMMYYNYAHNVEQDASGVVSDLLMDSKSIGSSLVTQGFPSDWNQTSVVIMGLTDGSQRIVQEKVDMFANMTYIQSRTNLRTRYDFYIYFEDMEGNRILVGEGQGIGQQPDSADNIVSLTRTVVYNSKIVNMVVQVWD